MKRIIISIAIATLWVASVPAQASAFYGGYRGAPGYTVHSYAPCPPPRSFGAYGYYKAPRRYAHSYRAPYGRYAHRNHWRRHAAPCGHHGCGKHRKQRQHHH